MLAQPVLQGVVLPPDELPKQRFVLALEPLDFCSKAIVCCQSFPLLGLRDPPRLTTGSIPGQAFLRCLVGHLDASVPVQRLSGVATVKTLLNLRNERLPGELSIPPVKESCDLLDAGVGEIWRP